VNRKVNISFGAWNSRSLSGRFIANSGQKLRNIICFNEDIRRVVGRGVTEPTGDDTFSMEIGIPVVVYGQVASHLSESHLQVKK
jgi:hypothetical protein